MFNVLLHRLGLACIAAVIALCLHAPGVGADGNWQARSFHADLAIEAAGTVLVTETITADFGAATKHGIYRHVPYRYRASDGSPYYLSIVPVAVEVNGGAVPYRISHDGGVMEFKIGDSDTLVSGIQQYVLSYRVTGALRGYEGYDELYWGVTGNAWEVTLGAVSVTVTVPSGEVVQAFCYQGALGGNEPCVGSGSGQAATFAATRPLPVGEGMTVAVGYPKGLVPLLEGVEPEDDAITLDDFSLPTLLASFLATLVVGLFLVVRHWWRVGRDAAEGALVYGSSIAPEFEVPGGLRPGEMGLLLDQRADTLDVSATIVDLAVRGYLTIAELPKKGLFGSVDYSLRRTAKAADGLHRYEELLLSSLFASGLAGDERLMSSLKASFYRQLMEVKRAMRKELVAKGLFTHDPDTVRAGMVGVGVASLVAGGFALIFGVAAASSWVPGIGAALVLIGISAFVVSPLMPRRTAEGQRLYQKILGYRMFLSATEKYRQPFLEKEGMFMELLPYAMVFGVAGKLAKAFDSMGLSSQEPAWYLGAHSHTLFEFTDTFYLFSKNMNATMASVPSGSGSGGGGFSGGGFGGGGGGSW